MLLASAFQCHMKVFILTTTDEIMDLSYKETYVHNNHRIIEELEWLEAIPKRVPQMGPPYVVYFDQLSGAACTRKLVKILLFSRFQPFFFFLNIFVALKACFSLFSRLVHNF